MGIEHLPCMTDLDKFANSLPTEHRAEVYRVAERFYTIGVGDGCLEGAMSTIGMSRGKEKTKSQEYREHLNRKIQEASGQAPSES